MAITLVGSQFVAADKVDGSGTYNNKPSLFRLRMPGSDGTNFLIGLGNVTNYNVGNDTFDLGIQASQLYPALAPTSAAPATGVVTNLLSASGVPDGDNNYSFAFAVRTDSGGYIAGINLGNNLANYSFQLS